MKTKKNKNNEVREEQENKLNVTPIINNNLMRQDSIINPTVFVEAKTKTDCQIVFLNNDDGRIDVWGYKPLYVDGWPCTLDGRPVKRSGQFYLDDNKWHFKSFRQTGGTRYEDLFSRQYSKLRRTQRELQLMIHIPRTMPSWVAERVMRDEFEKQLQFLKKNVWNQNRKEAA